MRFIAPRTGAPEMTIAEEQEEYMPITVAVYTNNNYPAATVMLCRLTLTDEERALVFGGEDIYVSQLVFPGRGFTPLDASVGPGIFAVSEEEKDG